ncbi:transposase [Nocardia seriolae]|nr:transposase [Nocardia seriolae]
MRCFGGSMAASSSSALRSMVSRTRRPTGLPHRMHPMTLSKWMWWADIDEGAKPGTGTSESA